MDFKPEFSSVNPLMILPFGILLVVMALAPLLFSAWWDRHYPKVVYGLAALVFAYYLLILQNPARVGQSAHEYVGFITLIGSLFIVSGGIHINVKGEATPFANLVFLAIGALTANLLGTTGASMLLIRPWLRMNKYRVTGHHVVFFIFIVANVGGCLTPIGDPPLFLGYLLGVPFWWVAEHCLPMWTVGVGILLAMFFVVDYRNYLRAPRPVRAQLTGPPETWRFTGMGNIFFLAIIIAAVLVNDPPFLRESLMIAAAAGSYFTTQTSVHESNHFTLRPIKEVAILFLGIFATMMPALDWLQANAGKLGPATPGFYYHGSGALSSVLDNAPTYLCFLKAIIGRFVPPDVLPQVTHLVQTHGAGLAGLTGPHSEAIRQTFMALQKYHAPSLARGLVSVDEIQVACLLGNLKFNTCLVAVSVGAVFFGANTYIGNGPNFMIKSIADHQHVHTPTFTGYVFKYTLPFMLPMLLMVWWLFFHQ